MSSIAADIDAQVARVAAIVSVPVHKDPRLAVNTKDVGVLIDPPSRDYLSLKQTWQIVVFRNTTDLGINTTTALSAVVAELEESDLPIEEARPGARRFGFERPAVPAYLITYTTP